MIDALCTQTLDRILDRILDRPVPGARRFSGGLSTSVWKRSTNELRQGPSRLGPPATKTANLNFQKPPEFPLGTFCNENPNSEVWEKRWRTFSTTVSAVDGELLSGCL